MEVSTRIPMSKKRKPKGSFGITSPGRAGRSSYARAGEILAPPQMRGKPGISGGASSRKNNDGDLFTRQNPYRRSRIRSACFIATACAEARGLPDDCYELSLLRVFREEYVAKLPDGVAVLAEYHEKAPRVVSAIEALGEDRAGEVWEYLYERGVSRAVGLILGGMWDEAFGVYEAVCREMEERFLSNSSPPVVFGVTPQSLGELGRRSNTRT
jgi:hypothetical protein